MLDINDGDIIEYKTPIGLRQGTVSDVGDNYIWLDVGPSTIPDMVIDRADVVRVVPWDEYLGGL